MPEILSAPGLTTGHAPFVEDARNRGELYITQAYELYTAERVWFHTSMRGIKNAARIA